MELEAKRAWFCMAPGDVFNSKYLHLNSEGTAAFGNAFVASTRQPQDQYLLLRYKVGGT